MTHRRRSRVLGALMALLAWSAAVAAFPAAGSSAAAGPQVRVENGLAYSSFRGHPLLLDAYVPATPGKDRPAMLLIHGGGWWSGSRANPRGVAEYLARHGWAAFSIGYTLDTPSLPGYPMQVEQCQAALRWVEDHAGEFHLDLHRLVVYGGSAGAYLASMVGVLGPGRPGYTPVAAAISISGPDDPALLVQEYKEHYPCRPTGCVKTYTALNHLSWFLGCQLEKCPAALLRTASPVDHVTAHSPPFFLYNSSEEIIPLSQATTMQAALKRAGVPVRLMVIPGTSHGPPSLLDVQQPITKFVDAYVPGPPAPVWPWVAGGAAAAVVAVALVVFSWERRRSQVGPLEGAGRQPPA